MRRVVIIVENLPVPFDRRVWSEATTLAENGYHVSVISPMMRGYDAAYEELDGVHIFRHPLYESEGSARGYLREYASAFWGQLRLAVKVKREQGFDVIHACNPPDFIFAVAALFKIFGVKFVFDHHDLCPELFEAKFNKRGVFYRFLRLAEKLTFGLADVSIATNQSYKRVAVQRGGMRASDVYVVRSGPKVEKLKLSPPVAAHRQGKKFLVGYVGVIGRQEGLDFLLESASRVLTQMGRDAVQFAVVGDGPQLAAVKQEAEDLGVADNFTFYGRASDSVLLEVLNTADVCVNPDRMSAMNDQSTMNKVLEYMTLAKPIVQFDLTEGKHSAGKASLYARPDDAADFADKIIELLENEDKRAEMGALGRARILNELSWAHSAPVLLKAYDAVFNGRGAAPMRKPRSLDHRPFASTRPSAS